MNDYMLTAGPRRDPVAYEVQTKDFLGSRVRIAIPQSGEPKILIDDVVRVLGPDSFGPQLVGVYDRYGVEIEVPTSGGTVWVKAITEKEMFDLLLRSHSEKMEPFRAWAVEILHAVHRTGRYAVASVPAVPHADDPIIALRLQQIEAEKRLTAVEQQVCESRRLSFEAKQIALGEDGYLTLSEYAARKGHCPSQEILKDEGSRLAGYLRRTGRGHCISTEKRNPGAHNSHPVNAYSIAILNREWWPRFAPKMGYSA